MPLSNALSDRLSLFAIHISSRATHNTQPSMGWEIYVLWEITKWWWAAVFRRENIYHEYGETRMKESLLRKVDVYFELRWLFCLSACFPALIWFQDLTQILATQITWVNFLSRPNLLVCWVLKLSPHRLQRRSAMFVKSKSWILLNLILLCGDVNINPGPNWNVPAGYVKIITSTNLPRLQTSVKFPTFVGYFLYFANYQTWSNYELLGALSSIVHRFSIPRQNPKLEKTVQRSTAFDRTGHPIYIFHTDTSYGCESVCSLCNKRRVGLHWNWRIETKIQLDINSTLYKVMYERTTEFVDLWMIITSRIADTEANNKELSWIKALPVQLKIPRKVTVLFTHAIKFHSPLY